MLLFPYLKRTTTPPVQDSDTGKPGPLPRKKKLFTVLFTALAKAGRTNENTTMFWKIISFAL